MPAFPSSVQKILELGGDINCPPKDLVVIIEKGPVMTMKILKVINSVYYSLPNKINSVAQSVVYLGINTVKSLAMPILPACCMISLSGFMQLTEIILSLFLDSR